MSENNIASAIERFYLDVVGTVVPGAIYSILIWSWLGYPYCSELFLLGAKLSLVFFLGLILCFFILGHITLCFYEQLISLAQLIANKIGKSKTSLLGRIDVITFRAAYLPPSFPAKAAYDFSFLRNLALSISPSGNQLVYKFVALSRLFGSFTLLAPTFLVLHWNWLSNRDKISLSLFTVLWIVAFYKKSVEFFRRSPRQFRSQSR